VWRTEKIQQFSGVSMPRRSNSYAVLEGGMCIFRASTEPKAFTTSRCCVEPLDRWSSISTRWAETSLFCHSWLRKARSNWSSFCLSDLSIELGQLQVRRSRELLSRRRERVNQDSSGNGQTNLRAALWPRSGLSESFERSDAEFCRCFGWQACRPSETTKPRHADMVGKPILSVRFR